MLLDEKAYHNSFMNAMPRTLSRKTLVLKMHWILAVLIFFITNSPLSFQNTIVVSNGLSHFHKMVIAVMKISFKNHSPIKRHCRDCIYFDQTN